MKETHHRTIDLVARHGGSQHAGRRLLEACLFSLQEETQGMRGRSALQTVCCLGVVWSMPRWAD